ncbi:ectonucleotide pyrophosphatase/phosphodiesterase [Sphingomonas sp. PL-96]|uniref:alkaline phosphatase family protein n=1 Tax=Sphingomonas sp. PL-96 TaxID=2887201 RepID=UPI001E3E3CCA|nr:ectonucleotide pyrophosphatase/phosphodiesterase [Sphingomonas sp. PL-96]MCC2976872.1 ectonucleotide pyrophosphatase/phosphodiesterase [Sphingomonas sp. PL-96]
MFKTRLLAALLAAAAFPAAAQTTQPVAPAQAATAQAEARAPVTILVSIDGFRPDYLARGVTPVLSRLAATGVTGPMHPSFPSKTFPNHWTLVTGVRPDRHGIVANRMEDPADPKNVFTMTSDEPEWWNAAEPIWVAAEKAGIRTATQFWPGSNVAIGGTRAAEWPHEITGGTRPSDWQQYNEAISPTQRVNGVLDWLRRPAAIRPRLLTLYFEAVDTAGHRFGPDSAEVNAAITGVDASIGALVDGLAALGQPANLVIVADHGMAATSSERAVALDKIADPALYHVVEAGPYASLTPLPGKEAAVEQALLKPHAHMQCWRKGEIPARFHYGRNPRVPAILCLAETGWQVLPTTPDRPQTGGNHGFDNMAPEMAALFIANGPAFASGRTLPGFDNVDVYPLLRDLIGLPAAAGVDGTDAPFRSVRKAQ